MPEQTQIQPQTPEVTTTTHIITAEDIPRVEDHDPMLDQYTGIDPVQYEQRMRQRFHERWTPRFKKVMVGLGLYGVVASGGLIDKVIDQTQDAGEHTALVLEQDVAVNEMPLTLDGIQFSDYPVEAQQEFSQEYGDKHEAAVLARDAVAQTMSDLDNHNTEQIALRAATFEKEHTADFLSEEKVQATHEAIDAAGSNQEVAEALQSATGFYGKEVSLDPSMTDLSDTTLKDNAHAVLNVLAKQPKSLATEAQFNTVVFTTLESMSSRDSHAGMTAGVYSPSNETITIGIAHEFGQRAVEVTNIHGPSVLGGGATREHIFAHEWGHALQASSEYGKIYGYKGENTPSGADSMTTYALRELVQMPDDHSMYGASGGPNEDEAEVYGALLDGGNGIVHPDEARRFGSQANSESLRVLMRLEEALPGITDYLAAQNHDLMGRSALQLGN